MLVLLLVVIFGLGMSFFATQNTATVHIIFGNYLISGIPLYVLVIGAMLLGIFISWLISIADNLSSRMTLHGKVTEIRKSQDIIQKLEQKNHALEVENAKLKSTLDSTDESDEDSGIESNLRPSLFRRVTHTLGVAGK